MTLPFEPSTRRRLACALIVAATATTLPASSSAVAADMAVRANPRTVVEAAWTGFYIGVHGGYGYGESEISDPNFQIAFEPVILKSNGGLVGAQIGADWQFGNFVVGAEIDASRSFVKGTRAPDPGFLFSGFSVDYRGLATATGRIGYAFGRVLGYAKGGLAWADIDLRSRVFTPSPLSIEHHRTGLVTGAGLEVLLFGGLSAKVEYNYLYFGAAAINYGSNQGPSNVDHALHLLKGGLNFRFGSDYWRS
jgi:outer membrane immunogenic protein